MEVEFILVFVAYWSSGMLAYFKDENSLDTPLGTKMCADRPRLLLLPPPLPPLYKPSHPRPSPSPTQFHLPPPTCTFFTLATCSTTLPYHPRLSKGAKAATSLEPSEQPDTFEHAFAVPAVGKKGLEETWWLCPDTPELSAEWLSLLCAP